MPHTFSLFGNIELKDPQGAVCTDILSQPKRAAILSYLAAAQPFGYHRRDKLLAVFWPDSDQSAARRSLNQSMHFLRRSLGTDCVRSRGAEEIGLAFDAIECDTMAFRQAIDDGDWAGVLSLYRGDLLDGFFVSDLPDFEQWLDATRIGYRDDAVRAAWTFSGELSSRGELTEARRWAGWATSTAPYDESSFRRYLGFLAETGDRATAVRAYDAFTSRLRDELGISPSVETAMLAEAIRSGTVVVESTTETRRVDKNMPTVVQEIDDAHPMSHSDAASEQLNTRRGRTVAHNVPSTSVVLASEWWSRIALIGAAGAGVLGIVYLAMMQLGLPTWFFVGAGALVFVGFLVLVATVSSERRRATAVTQSTMYAAGVSDLLRWRPALAAGLVAWLGLGSVMVGYIVLRALGIGPPATLFTRGVLLSQDEILLGEFEGQGADSLLGHAMTEAIRIDLSQSRAVRLVNPDRILSTLRLMSATPATFLDRETARGVAQRLGVKAIVRGDITSIGDGFLVTVSLISTDNGSILWADRAKATNEDLLIETIGDLSRDLRVEIGESLRDLRATPPLEEVTTTSVAALKAFSEALVTTRFRDQRDAIPLYERAIAADSTFAVAYMRIARVLANTGGSLTRQVAMIDRAFQLRSNTTEIERLWIESQYYALTGETDQALETWRTLNRLQPNVQNWWNNVGNRVSANLPARFPDPDEGVPYLWRAFELCQCAFPLGNLTRALLMADLADSAQQVIEMYSPRFPEMGGSVWGILKAAHAYAVGDQPLTLRELEAAGPRLRDMSAVFAVQARLAESRATFQQWVRMRGFDGPADTYLSAIANHELLELALGDSPDDAIRRVENVLRSFPLDSIEPLDRPYVSLAEFFVRAGAVDRATGLIAEFEAVVDPRWRRVNVWRHLLVRGLIEQEQFGSEQALPMFEQSVQAAHAFLAPVPDFGFALEQTGATDSAISVYERFIGPSPRYAAWGFDARWRAPVLRRLGELYEERGNRGRALEYYGKFVDQWEEADAILQPQVAEIEQRIERLAREGITPNR